MTVVETPTYFAAAEALLTEEERKRLVDRIARDPREGDLIPGTGGLRKLRVAMRGTGKRGGGRLITYFYDEDMPVFLIALYAKSTQTDLSPEQRKGAMALTEVHTPTVREISHAAKGF